MLVLTIQEKNVVSKIKAGVYKPNFWNSPFSCMSIAFTKGYTVLLNSLKKKTGIYPSEEDSCMWGWVKAPYIKFHTGSYNWHEKVALFVEIPESEVVLSDFDKFSDYVFGESCDSCEDFILDSVPEGDEYCVQGCFWDIKPENILLEVSLESICNKEEITSVESLFISTVLMQDFEYLLQNLYKNKAVGVED